MATAPKSSWVTDQPAELRTGDHMTQREFHRIYEQTPESFRAELIGGIVYVASPLSRPHGRIHPALATLFFTYAARTPGVETCDNATVLLGDEGEPQPDSFLRILPEFGGQSRDVGDYVVGAPELIAEIAYSSRAIDLYAKRYDYRRYGVLEYIVVCLGDDTLRWFDLRGDQELSHHGIVRVRVFPGLWVDAAALFAKNHRRLMATLELGLATREHADFVRRLAQTKAKRKRRRK